MGRHITRAAVLMDIVRTAAVAGLAAVAAQAWAATPSPGPAQAVPAPHGAALYAQRCAKCHEHAQGHIPSREALANRPATNILMALLTGPMRPEAAGLSRADASAIAAYLTAGAATASLHPNPCRRPLAPMRLSPADWNGWSRDPANTRFQRHGGLTAREVPRLELKWAFAYPGAMTWGQPTVVGGRVFVASATGEVYALDAATGCTVWSLDVGTPVRTAITIGAAVGRGAQSHRLIAYFGDISAVAHAVDAQTGAPLWHMRVDAHPSARITGSPVLDGKRLLVPVSSFEEGAAADIHYACCTFRGSVVALDAASGRLLWKRRTIARHPQPYHRTGDPMVLNGPAGGAVWNAPT
ncbi:MAG: PQQ-binding-like beta-propeller repeat protein, partial [Steroidobacteraceae bacterium]